MARKKASQQQQEKPHESAMEDPTAEKFASLKTLNAFLLKETVERRQQVDALLQSKEALESENYKALLEKQRLESEKWFFEEQTIVAELEQSLTLTFVSSQLNQTTRENEETRAQAEIFKAKLEDKINDKEKARKATETRMEEQQKEMNQMSDDFRRYKDEVRKDLDLKQEETNRLRSMAVELEKSNAEAREEIGRRQMELDQVRQEMERRNGDLKREMETAVRELRDEIEVARNEHVCEIDSLKKSVDVLTADLSSCEREASDRVLREKDLIQQDLHIHIEEIKGLRSTLLELEKSRSDTNGKHHQLQTEHKLLWEDKEKLERNHASLERDKASIERSMKQSSQKIEDLKREIKQLVEDKQQIQYERTHKAVKITELQKQVAQLSSTISSLQKQEEGLQLKISELGISNADAREKQEKLLMEFNALVKEKERRERISEKLEEEKSLANQTLEGSLQRLDEQGQKMQEIVLEKAEIAKVKIKLEAEILKLHKEMGKLRSTVSTLQESRREHEENNIQLQAEAIQNRDALDRVGLERDNALKLLSMEKKEFSSLRLKLLELEKSVEETKEENAQLSTERDRLVKEKKEMESSFRLLTQETASLKKSLLEAQQGLGDLQAKMTSTNKLSERTLSMLKDTVAIVRGPTEEKDGKGEAGIDAENIEVEIRPFASELEAIKRSFRNTEAKLEDLTQRLIEARKKKSLWALLSSATTIFAAVSVAYVARVH